MGRRYWKTKAGVLVTDINWLLTLDRRGRLAEKILCGRVPSGGCHGWVWLKNLTPTKAPKRKLHRQWLKNLGATPKRRK